MRRLAPLALIAAALSGCGLFTDDAPSMFEATYSGAASGTLAGAYSYTHQFRYGGIGSSDTYDILLSESEPGQAGGSPDGIRLVFSGIGDPSGTYVIGRPPYAGATFAVDGRFYYVREGVITVARADDRFAGTFRFTDSFTIESADTTSVVMDGRFDVVRND